MKPLAFALAFATLAAPLCPAQGWTSLPGRTTPGGGRADQTSTTVVHKDGTYSTVVRDASARTLVRETKRKGSHGRPGTLIMRSQFTLDEFGRERRGQVFDASGRLLFVSDFIYAGGKLAEERVYNARGELVRRLDYANPVIGRGGRPMPRTTTYTRGHDIGQLVPLDDYGDSETSPYSTTSSHAHSPGTIVRSADGSAARVSGDAVRYPGFDPSARPSSGAASGGGASRQSGERQEERRGLLRRAFGRR